MLQRSKSPQPYNAFSEQGAYLFQTDYGLTYACGFHNLTPQLPPMLGIYDIRISDIEFNYYDPTPAVKKPHDPRIRPTITGIMIMSGYFETENDVLIYLCDSLDGRAHERQALFTRWHRDIADLVSHDKVRIGFGEYEVLGGIFIPKKFPYPEVLQRELMDNAVKLIMNDLAAELTRYQNSRSCCS